MKDKEYLEKYLAEEDYQEGLEKLKSGIPVQYIVGNVDFYGYKINVNENVLIPRFETEELIEKTLKYLPKKEFYNIIDLGTGSGCIAIVLKDKINNSMVTAVDISEKALEVAKDNAMINDVDINFICGNMLENINDKYDLIISNPPYISYDEEIMDIVKDNEPHLALYADNNGLYFYEEILKKCLNNLNNNYLIAFEIGYKQADDIRKMANKYLKNIEIIVEKDLSGKDRFVFIRD